MQYLGGYMKQVELWDAYDAEGNLTGGTLVRGESIPQGIYHLVTCVLVRHTDGDFLLMQRSPEKSYFPNIWEIGAGGSALKGESAEESIRRELREETGIDRGTFRYIGRNWDHPEGAMYEGFCCITDYPKDQIRLQKGETSAYRWLNREAFLQFFYSDECLERMRNRLLDFVGQL